MNRPQLQRFVTLLLCLIMVLSLAVPAFAADGTAAPNTPASASGWPQEAGLLVYPTDMYFTDDYPTPISCAEDLLLLAEEPQGSFRLVRDIDMSELAPASDPDGANWTPIAFSGVLQGAGHTIYNLKIADFGGGTYQTVDGNDKVYETLCAGLFSALDGAWITDLTIRGADINVRGEQNCFAGVLAGWMKNTAVRNVTIADSRVRLTAACKPEPGATDKGKPRTSCNAGVGGIAGFGSAVVEDCSVDVTLVFADECDPSLKVEEFLGGIVSAGNVKLSGTNVTIDGWAAIRGYAHNGGLVGMFYVYDKSEEQGFIDSCRVDGSISFYENNKDRRAYCDPYIGEKMTWPKLTNLSNSFKNKETRDYSAKMDPEQCDSPTLTERTVAGDCNSLGYTEHTCSTCGNTRKDSFTAKVHQPGEWEMVSFPDRGPQDPGNRFRVRKCKLCGEYTEIQLLKDPTSLDFDRTASRLYYKQSETLAPDVTPEDAWTEDLVWSSTDEKVATVTQDGTVTAVGRGNCVISCSTPDGKVSAQTTMEVRYTLKQWLIKIFLFGWIWY